MIPVEDLYIHIPFCRSRCSYCGFVSSVPAPGAMDGYGALLMREAARRFPAGLPVLKTVYIGGGTPTFLPEQELRSLLALVSRFISGETVEVSIEATPRTITAGLARMLQEAGVTRVTMGLQSGDRQVLRPLGREDGMEELEAAVGSLRDAGIRHIGIDLIVGLPGETRAGWRCMVRRLARLGVDHLSAYLLVLDQGVPLARAVQAGRVRLPEDWRTRRMFQFLSLRLQEAGFYRYEVSNFGRNGARGEHNMRIWQGRPYAGMGVGAVGCDGLCRMVNPDTLNGYVSWLDTEDDGYLQTDRLTKEKRVVELLLLGLRTDQGVDPDRLVEETGYILPTDKRLELVDDGLIREDAGRIFATRKGWFWLDDLIYALSG